MTEDIEDAPDTWGTWGEDDELGALHYLTAEGVQINFAQANLDV